MVPVKVRTYDGYKAEEFPVSILMENRQVHVKVLRQWTEVEVNSGKGLRGFLVETTDRGERFKLYQDVQTGRWFIKHP